MMQEIFHMASQVSHTQLLSTYAIQLLTVISTTLSRRLSSASGRSLVSAV